MPTYPTDLTLQQSLLLHSNLSGLGARLRKHRLEEILNAIFYVAKTGCQWRMLPSEFPKWRAVYHHFRSFAEKGILPTLLHSLVRGKRAAIGDNPDAEISVIDSESIRSALPQSEKGIDGHKKIKGIKRHILTDENGFPLAIHITRANVYDSPAAITLWEECRAELSHIIGIKADKGYRGFDAYMCDAYPGILVSCSKSNFGDSKFIPTDGRWVVERTFSWMTNYRRLTRNYEKYLFTAKEMWLFAAISFMLRYFRQ